MKPQISNSLATLFAYYIKSGQYLIAKEIAIKMKNEKCMDIDYLLNCLEMWVQLNEYDKAIETIHLLSVAQYPPQGCELCLQLVKFRLNKIHSDADALKCAQVLLSAGKLAEAEQVLHHALDLNSENSHAKTQLAKFYLDVGNLQLASSLAEEITKVEESNSKAWTIYGNAQRMQGNELTAYKAHLKALTLDNENYESLLDVTAIEVSQAKTLQEFEQSIKSSKRCLQVFMKNHYKLEDLEASFCKVKHDNEQAKYLLSNGLLSNINEYIEVTDRILSDLEGADPSIELKVSVAELALIHDYNQKIFISDQNLDFGPCLNSSLDWTSIAHQYKYSSPSLVVIDNFLNPEALNYLRRFCYESKVWHKTYQHAYLGAFVDKGFLSNVHLKISEELKICLSDVIGSDRLEQLWAFKYDSVLGKGINIHADFAKINLNFWITPDEYHLNKENGGLIVYTEPAPRNWNYFDYNINSDKIYEYLSQHNSSSVTVPYKANRAVLFDSTLFHETDEIKFEDSYLGRRINMTYLFGVQLK
jgi:hypothetical protein